MEIYEACGVAISDAVDAEQLRPIQFEELVTEPEPIRTWAEFQDWFGPFSSTGSFRGHRVADWKLVTTLDRAVTQTVKIETEDIISESVGRINSLENEKNLLLDFQRGAHRHHEDVPESNETIDWLALMQHYGAPTRLLDWTTSPYVALYFALEDNSSEDSALWAINQSWLDQRSYELISANYSNCPTEREFHTWHRYLNEIILAEGSNHPIIVVAPPLRLNERINIQQGQLLTNLRHDISFSTALLGMLVRPTVADEQVVSRIVLKRDQRIRFLEELRRMNIHRASLFPGLDGFAKSLSVNLEIAVAKQIEGQKEQTIKMIRESRLKRRA